MSKIVKKKDLDVLIENTMAKAGIIKESMPLGRAMGTAAAIVAPLAALVLSVQHENFISVTDKTGNERTPEKGETFVGKIVDLEEPEFLKGGTIVTMETKNGEIVKFQHRVKVRGNVGETIKVKVESGTFIWPDYDVKHTNESKLNIGKLINEGDYYGSFGNMGKWYDEQDREYEMEDGDWDEDEYATWDEYSNSPYGASASNRWSINPSAKSGGWNPEMAFNQYVDTHGPMRVRRRKMTQPDMMESKSNKKPLINENVQKELDRFNRLSNYTFKK